MLWESQLSYFEPQEEGSREGGKRGLCLKGRVIKWTVVDSRGRKGDVRVGTEAWCCEPGFKLLNCFWRSR